MAESSHEELKLWSEKLKESREKARLVSEKFVYDYLHETIHLAIEDSILEAERKGKYSKETLSNYRRHLLILGEREGILDLQAPVHSLRCRERSVMYDVQFNMLYTDAQRILRINALTFLFRHLELETECEVVYRKK